MSKFEDIFNVSTYRYGNEEAFVFTHKVSTNSSLKFLPDLQLLVTTDPIHPDKMSIDLVTYNGSLIQRENINAQFGLESSNLFKDFKKKNFNFCPG